MFFLRKAIVLLIFLLPMVWIVHRLTSSGDVQQTSVREDVINSMIQEVEPNSDDMDEEWDTLRELDNGKGWEQLGAENKESLNTDEDIIEWETIAEDEQGHFEDKINDLGDDQMVSDLFVDTEENKVDDIMNDFDLDSAEEVEYFKEKPVLNSKPEYDTEWLNEDENIDDIEQDNMVSELLADTAQNQLDDIMDDFEYDNAEEDTNFNDKNVFKNILEDDVEWLNDDANIDDIEQDNMVSALFDDTEQNMLETTMDEFDDYHTKEEELFNDRNNLKNNAEDNSEWLNEDDASKINKDEESWLTDQEKIIEELNTHSDIDDEDMADLEDKIGEEDLDVEQQENEVDAMENELEGELEEQEVDDLIVQKDRKFKKDDVRIF